jgi:glycosidase
MNHIGTHDTARILTRLGTNERYDGDREKQSQFALTEQELENAVNRLKLAAVLQYTLPGVPSVFYGDEAGVQGFGDPFCRATYPWGKENCEILEFYKSLGSLRKNNAVFKDGEFIPVVSNGDAVAYIRKSGDEALLIAVNPSKNAEKINLPYGYEFYKHLFGAEIANANFVLSGESFAVIKLKKV